MTVPSRRLVYVSLLVLPVATLSVLSAGMGGLALLVCLGLTAVALLDLLSSRRGGSPFQIDTPEDIRLAKYREGSWDLRFAVHQSMHQVKVGIPFPRELGPVIEEQTIGDVEADQTYKAEWAFKPLLRGEYHVPSVHFACRSGMGLWELRWDVPASLVFKVHPDLSRERKVMANLFMNRGLSGMRTQRVAGKGRDYDQIREYRTGDTLADIHWKATAKRNSLMTKSYQIERTQEVYIVVDHSRLSGRPQPFKDGESPEPVLERFVATANILAMAALREGDLFGFMSFARHTDHFIKAGSGTAHLRVLQNALFKLESEAVYPDYDEWVRFTRTRLRTRSLLILLTDLSDATTVDLLAKRVGLLAKTHQVVVAMIPMPGVEPLFEGADAPEDPWKGLAGHLMWRELHAAQKRLRVLGVPLLLPQADRLALDVVDEYLNLKQQQRL